MTYAVKTKGLTKEFAGKESMINLIKPEFYKLKKSKAFYILLAVCAAFAVVSKLAALSPTSFDIARGVIVSIVYTIAATIAGCVLFRKQDIK